MRYRWKFPTALSVLVVAVVAALLFWPGVEPQVDCKLQSLPNGLSFMTSPSSCARAIAATAAWQVQKNEWLSKGAAMRIDRASLEECAVFMPSVPPGVPAFCSNERLKNIYADWMDWRGRAFSGSAFRDRDDGPAIARSNLVNALFAYGDASRINLSGSILLNATFDGTNLEHAFFTNTDLRGATFKNASLANAFFFGADLDGVLYEPVAGQLPDLASVAAARNLQGLRWEATPQQLNELREAFYKAGLPHQGQQITFAIERSRRVKEGKSPDWLDRLSSWGRRIAFEWTAAYGLRPFQPLLILVVLIPLFAPVYLASLHVGGPGRLWISRPDKAISRPSSGRWLPLRRVVRGKPVVRLLRYLRACLWFSTMCAFRIGYKDVNVGDWITRLQAREYLLGATGWCRTVAGVQSLVSVYLLALTVLCIIGRPFG